jgi:L-idonate 5-dehydrogenase
VPLTQSLPEKQLAAVLHPEGGLRLVVRPVPEPGSDEVLIEVAAVGICGSDTAYARGTAKYTVRQPLIMGHEAAGLVAALGPGAQSAGIGVGTAVAISPGLSCGACALCRSGRDNLCAQVRYLGSAAAFPHVNGALQQYVVIPVANLVPLPANVSTQVGALLEPLAVAHHAVSRVDASGKSILVTGGGAIGQLICMVAHAAGAASVTLSETLPARRQAALAHGVDHVLDPATANADGQSFDVVFEASGHPAALNYALRATDPSHGKVVLVGNLPAGHGIPASALSAGEPWVTATMRFPGGVGPALDFLTKHQLELGWLVERTFSLERINDAFELAMSPSAPLKVQVTPSTHSGAVIPDQASQPTSQPNQEEPS